MKSDISVLPLTCKITEIMTIIEASKAMQEGKKVRNKSWVFRKYIYADGDKIISNTDDGLSNYIILTMDGCLSDDWEVVEPEQSPVERSWEHYKSVKDYLQDTSYAHIAFKDAWKLCETHQSEQQKKIALAFRQWCFDNPEYVLDNGKKYDIFIKQYKPE